MMNMKEGEPSPVEQSNQLVDENKVTNHRHVGVENLLPPNVDENVGTIGRTKLKNDDLDLERGETSEQGYDDKNKCNCFGKNDKKKVKKSKPTVPWSSLVGLNTHFFQLLKFY